MVTVGPENLAQAKVEKADYLGITARPFPVISRKARSKSLGMPKRSRATICSHATSFIDSSSLIFYRSLRTDSIRKKFDSIKFIHNPSENGKYLRDRVSLES